ncbi:DUF3987 domain-containing protein [Acinetobacter nectaris]|uniref:DUF3987 domain-containing protein n=1 Tax=Acinetobacter nectaris TaxID=1219382 RepID=UPI001F2B8AAD|nr:DUF3987 domain-containing protein [Acinetobacter nectaris]MCF8999197.1 DUF3987 domain-containing protein [Acinetobacter nectaris]MCF9026478.1 DUF3987 domain-containing protein [Acinetobacter nectaris]
MTAQSQLHRPCFDDAKYMLNILGPGESFTFQTFDDTGSKNKILVSTISGPLEKCFNSLESHNKHGGGVFVTVNQTDGIGRKRENIKRVRALYVDFDKVNNDRVGDLVNLDLAPNMVIESSKGKHHAYWVLDNNPTIPLDQFTRLQKRLIQYFADDGADKAVHDLPRVMRLAGFYHRKNEPYLTNVAYVENRLYSAYEVINFVQSLPVVDVEQSKQQTNKKPIAHHMQTTSNTVNALNRQSTLNTTRIIPLDFKQAKLLARGRWNEIFTRLGYDVSVNSTKHTPCPMCGGKDRFRFDNQNGDGSFICGQGGDSSTIGGDGFTLLEHGGLTKSEALHKVVDALHVMGLILPFDSSSQSHKWQEPEPLKLKSEYVEGEYPIHAFPEIAQRAINKSAFYNHVPIALAGQFALGVMTYIAQEHVQAPSDKSRHGQPCSLALFTIFESGGGKDETSKLLGKSILDLENRAMQKFKDEVLAHKALDKGKRAVTPYPINTTTMFDKGTVQGLVKFMSNSPMANFMWQVTEGAKVLGGYSLTSETVGESLGVINTLIDQGKTSTILRSAEEPEIVIGKRFSLDLSIQEVMARKVLNNEIFRLQGFLARFLFAAPEPLPFRIVTKKDRQIKADEDADIVAFTEFCERLKNPPQKESGFVEPERILFNKSSEADDIHIKYENYINQKCANGGLYAHIRPNAKRTIQYCLRIAAVLAYFTPELDEVDARTMQSAIDLCKYSLDEWVRYYANSEESDSQLLLAFLKKQKQPEIKKSYVQQNCPSKFRNKSSVLNDALIHLVDSGYITITESKPIKIILNPKC